MSSNPVPHAAGTADRAAMGASPPIATSPAAIPAAITSPYAISSTLSSASRNYHLSSSLFAPVAGTHQYHAAHALGAAFPATAPPAYHTGAHAPVATFGGVQHPRRPFAAVPIPIPGGAMPAPPPLPPPRHIQELSAGRDIGWAFGNPSMASSGGGMVSPFHPPVSQILPVNDGLPRVQRGIKVASRHVIRRDGGDHGRPRKRRSLGTPLGAEAAVVVDSGAAERNSWRLSLPGNLEKDHLPMNDSFDRQQLSRLNGIAGERPHDPAADMQHGDCSLPPLRGFVPSLPLRHDPASAPASTTALSTLSTRRGINRAPDALNKLVIPGPGAAMHGSPESSWQFSPPALPSSAVSVHRSPIREGHSSDSSQVSPLHGTDRHGLFGHTSLPLRGVDQGVFGLEIDDHQTTRDADVELDDIGGRQVKRRKPSSVRDVGEDRAMSLEMRRRPSQHNLPSLTAQMSRSPGPSSFTPSLVSSTSLSAASSLGTQASTEFRPTNMVSGVSPEAGDSKVAVVVPGSPTEEREPERLRKMNPFSLHRFGELQPERGPFMCDCCHKNPRYFDNLKELFAHEAVKQYKCGYCNNRFKNKNEAERHQNSLHLRHYSWSCAALGTIADAFHARPPAYPGAPHSPAGGGDTCCYCGQVFDNPPNWKHRTDHLLLDHKFGECNQNKKFFRADHFRQHLKHSHAAVVGKWTNYLESACMMQRVAVGRMAVGLPPQEGALQEGVDEGPPDPSEDGEGEDE